MICRQIVIVGGGPAGAACADKLVAAGLNPLVVDQAAFPRQKVCAGWLTPDVFDSLEMRPEEYPGDLSVFPNLKIYLNGFPLTRPGKQYAIRRMEFDHWLLDRSGAEVIQHEVKDIQLAAGKYLLDGQIECEVLVAAGGTHCPVFRHFYGERHPRNGAKIIALEDEFQEDWQDPVCRLWFFENGLPGYAWYVPKTGGYLNIGVGGNLEKLKQRETTIQDHWEYLVRKIRKLGLTRKKGLEPRGYLYHLRGKDPQRLAENLYLIGDAAGLATLDMGEGIGPAIQSGLLAAKAISGEASFSYHAVERYSLLPSWLRWFLPGGAGQIGRG